MPELEQLRYPVGRFKPQETLSLVDRKTCIGIIAECPEHLDWSLAGLKSDQLDTPYREDGWTVRQLVHHMYDSHSNAFIRFRLALTEENPKVTAYNEKAWANLTDSLTVEASVSAELLRGLHRRWVAMLNGMTGDQFARTLNHPENGLVSLNFMVQLYAWHCRHHVRHITALRERMEW